MAEREDDRYREKFRPSDDALDREVEAALGGVSIDELLNTDNAAVGEAATSGGASGSAHQPGQKGPRRGRILSVDQPKDEVFVDFGGKSQGIASLSQFEEIPAVGAEMEFNVERYDPREGLLILSRKGATAQNVSWETLEVGQIVEGTVTGVNKGGLEVNVKNMRAFMPSGQVDLYFTPDLSVFLNQKVTAEVTQFDPGARNIILSRRNVLEREKEEAKQKLMTEIEVGQTRRGTVRSVTDYGAFIDLGGVDGLLHVSEMSHRRGVKPSDFVKVGDLVDVKIIRIDRETGKLGLSLKQTMADPWVGAETKYGPGTPVTGRVTKVENFGAFIEIEEGVEGLLPVSEISWQRIRHPSEVVKEGDTLRLVVLSLDPANKRISFSLKQAGPDPWKTINERYAVDMIVDGVVTRTADFGAFVELEPGLEGLVHISELSNQRVRAVTDVVKQGQTVRVRILDIDKDARRVSLSIKRAAEAISPTATPAQQGSASTATKQKKRPPLKGGLDF
jgi:small subunit ribosomal protein S1